MVLRFYQGLGLESFILRSALPDTHRSRLRRVLLNRSMYPKSATFGLKGASTLGPQYIQIGYRDL